MTNQPTPRDLVKVKALEWTEFDDYGDPGYKSWLGGYKLRRSHRGMWYITHEQYNYPELELIDYVSLSAAQAACQAHYEQTIYELLEAR